MGMWPGKKGEGKREKMCARGGREVGGAGTCTMSMQNVLTAICV